MQTLQCLHNGASLSEVGGQKRDVRLRSVTFVATVLILASTVLDVASTNLGVLILGNGEASPIARYVIKTLGTNWWLFYFPYEFGALSLAFFVLRKTRLSLVERFEHYPILVFLKVEYMVILATFITIVNNAILLLLRFGKI